MDTSSGVARFKQKLSRIASIGRDLPKRLFGNFTWRPPGWLTWASERWQRLERDHPRGLPAIIISIFLVASAAAWTWNWYDHLPKPRTVSVTVQPIEVTKLEKELKFPRLVIYFSESAARIEDLHQTAVQGVRLDPQVLGAWHWARADILVFDPKQDWPPNQKYRVVFERSVFPRHVMMKRLVYDAETPPFVITLKKPELYTDPTDPTLRQVTATVELTHPVEPGELERKIELSMIGGTEVFRPNDPAPHFTITYGLHRRLAYVRTSPINLPEHDDFMKLIVSGGVQSGPGGARTQYPIEAKLRIPAAESMFQIESIAGTIARNKQDESEQLIVLTTTVDISTRELAKAMELRLLPKRPKSDDPSAVTDQNGENEAPADENGDADNRSEASDDEESDPNDGGENSQLKDAECWQSPTAVPDDVLDHARVVRYEAKPSEKPQSRQHVFRVRLDGDGELYVRIHKGVRAFGNYPLKDDYSAIVRIPELPREVQIEGEGGLLALNGEHKLSIRSRGLAAIEYEIARVSTSQINHLVSQTQGKFQHPHFAASYSFNQENISRIALERQDIALEDKWKANYSAFDFSNHLRKPDDGGSERGLFFLTARGWDPGRKKTINGIRDSRFVLVTDIGILTKRNADGSTDVFLMSIKEGKPIAGVPVELLGKNGVALQTASTDGHGRCTFSSVDKLSREKTPVAFVARNGDDVSFIAYARDDREVNFSRFDIDGIENVLPENLDAFVFTERGIYRPGDEIHIGLAVKQRNWAGQLKGLPVETEVLDARGHSVQIKKINLPDGAFAEFGYTTASESPTGLYTFNVYLTRNNKRGTLLGSTTANVKEFLPDRLRIQSRLSPEAVAGWMNPKTVEAFISLANLYGTPATDRRVTARLELIPSAFRFAEFPNYRFFDPLGNGHGAHQEHTIDLGEKHTDDKGETQFDLQLDRFRDATYSMRFISEGFEAEGGRSVTAMAETLVSALPYVVGCKPDGDLRYVELNKGRAIDLVAVDPRLHRIALENITANIIAQEYVSVLAKQDNGNYAYESVLKERTAKSESIAISANGSRYALLTDEPGNYVFELRDDQNRRLCKLEYSVVGIGRVNRALEKNAELQIKLDHAEYNSGDDIAISITAPYAGNGLITIERDRVYAQEWFHADGANSVQRIRVPANFEGTGYVNVAFVRSLDSKEVFVSPLSYGVVPFTANREKRRLNLQVDCPSKAKPGDKLRISYLADRPARIVIFAVDEGILQVTNFETPDPLAFFFRKCALRVETAQIVDLLIPEFSLLRSVSAYGGGGDVQKLNPFKRITDKPVVFWSGIIEAGPEKREVVYDVPDYFDGTLRLMAVAVSDDTVGAAERKTLVSGPFVITPSVPVLAAPGDEFESGVTVANNVEKSGQNAEIEISARPNERLSIIGPANKKIVIAEGREQSVVFRFRVNDRLGNAEIGFMARANGEEAKRRATLSIRPAVPYVTEIRSGLFTNGSKEVPISRATYGEFHKLDSTISALPIGLARGLDVYLKNFPYGCSEQITSGAFCRLMLAGEADFGLSRAEINKQLEYTFGVLRRRQNDQGGFGYWIPEPDDHISFISAYVMDFLSDAKAAGFPPPADMFASGLRNLQKMAARQPAGLGEARTVAYAIYVLSREGVITTNYILNLQDYLQKNERDHWQDDLTGVYIAGALHLLHKDSEAEKLIGSYRLEQPTRRTGDDFCQPLGSDSQYVAVLAREFPVRLRKMSGQQFERIVRAIGADEFNTLSAAYAVKALKAYSQAVAQNPPALSITELRRDKSEVRLAAGTKVLLRSDCLPGAAAIRFNASRQGSGPGVFYQVAESGFDRKAPDYAVTDGLEIYRELLGKNNQPVAQTHLGEPVRVRLHVRSLKHQPITNVAIIDLLPGGFEVVDSSARTGSCSSMGADYVDVREDRVVFFATVPVAGLDIDYTIKSCNRGKFVVPPVFAESMYDRKIKASGVGGAITVIE